uniref:Testis expressed 36 n=1 Tax=Cairina moschata TaxID=8855 RepID=A0A8C3C811_CAIMO
MATVVCRGLPARVARASSTHGAMPKDRWPSPSTERPGAWFAHVGGCQSQPESTTSSALKQAQDAQAAQHMEGRLPLTYRAREQRAVKNNFPFSSHDNRHCLQNVGEYFDFGMGRRKVEPERRQQNSHNFFLWAHESVPSSEDGLTIYQTSFVKDQNTESPFCRRYPKHHTKESHTDKSAPENEKNMQPNKSS